MLHCSIIREVGYLEEFLVLEVDSAISLVLVNLDLDRDVLVVGIINILDCIAERDGWGEASFILTGRYFIDPFDSLFTLSRGGAATSFRLPGFRHGNHSCR